MFASRQNRTSISQSQKLFNQGVVRKPKKLKGKLFTDFSRVFQFGRMAVKYEGERYQVKRAWDAKVPKQHQQSNKKMAMPPAPMPDHLKIPPNISVNPDDERKLRNSQARDT